MRTGLLIVVLLARFPLATAEVRSVAVALPADIDWVSVSDRSDGDTYLREWIPSGSTIEDADWLIVEQRLSLTRKRSARRHLNTMMKLARKILHRRSLQRPGKDRCR